MAKGFYDMRKTATLYDVLDAAGYEFEPAPRSNPSGSLGYPWRVRCKKTDLVMLRGGSRDALEEACYTAARRGKSLFGKVLLAAGLEVS